MTHNDYAAASRKGGNELNMAADSLTGAQWLRGRGFNSVGSMGESQGGGAAVMMQQKFAQALVERNVRRLYQNEVDDSGVTELNSGMKAAGDDVNAMMARCVGTVFHSGYWKDRFVAVPHWIGFFRRNL